MLPQVSQNASIGNKKNRWMKRTGKYIIYRHKHPISTYLVLQNVPWLPFSTVASLAGKAGVWHTLCLTVPCREPLGWAYEMAEAGWRLGPREMMQSLLPHSPDCLPPDRGAAACRCTRRDGPPYGLFPSAPAQPDNGFREQNRAASLRLWCGGECKSYDGTRKNLIGWQRQRLFQTGNCNISCLHRS